MTPKHYSPFVFSLYIIDKQTTNHIIVGTRQLRETTIQRTRILFGHFLCGFSGSNNLSRLCKIVQLRSLFLFSLHHICISTIFSVHQTPPVSVTCIITTFSLLLFLLTICISTNKLVRYKSFSRFQTLCVVKSRSLHRLHYLRYARRREKINFQGLAHLLSLLVFLPLVGFNHPLMIVHMKGTLSPSPYPCLARKQTTEILSISNPTSIHPLP